MPILHKEVLRYRAIAWVILRQKEDSPDGLADKTRKWPSGQIVGKQTGNSLKKDIKDFLGNPARFGFPSTKARIEPLRWAVVNRCR